MPDVWPKVDGLAIFISDVHLSDTPPIFRSVEEDWFAVQEDYLMQVFRTCQHYNAPLVIAGDLFHKYNPSVELINRSITWFQQFTTCGINVYTIPGQHDLPHHRYQDWYKSAYGTLVKAGVIHDINMDPTSVGGRINTVKKRWLFLHGFPWGAPLTPNKKKGYYEEGTINVAVVHDYCWLAGHCHPGASEDKHAAAHAKNLGGFDAAFFGDNHSPLMVKARDADGKMVTIVNCGGFMRRDITQLNHNPCMYLLDASCKVHPIKLDISKDKVTTDHVTAAAEGESEVIQGAGEFLKSLDEMGQLLVDFKAATREYMEGKGTPPKVQDLVYRFIPTTEDKK